MFAFFNFVCFQGILRPKELMEMISGCEDYDDFMLLKEVNFLCRSLMIRRVSKKIVSRLCDCYGGAVALIVSVCTRLHTSDFNVEFDTLFESI